MDQSIINQFKKEINHSDTISRDAILQILLLNSSHHPIRSTEINSLFKQRLLQERQNHLRTKTLLDNPNQILTDIAATLHPQYSKLLERDLMLRTQALTALAYRDTFRSIQDQESSLFPPLRRRIDFATTKLPLEYKSQQCQTLNNERDANLNLCKDKNTKHRNLRDPTHTFPCILHEILSNPEYHDCITWLPHGRGWRILRRLQFERVVIPRHFRHGRYSSFMRQVRNNSTCVIFNRSMVHIRKCWIFLVNLWVHDTLDNILNLLSEMIFASKPIIYPELTFHDVNR
jgi:hypothetical protein